MGVSSAPPAAIVSHCRNEIRAASNPTRRPESSSASAPATSRRVWTSSTPSTARAASRYRKSVYRVVVPVRVDEQGAIRALEAGQVADVDAVGDEKRLGEPCGQAIEAAH